MRVAFVTGASKGIGRAIAIALACDGHSVGFCYGADIDGANETQSAIEAEGAKAVAVQSDVTDPAAVDAAFGEVEAAFGKVTILVNNAGITHDGLVARMTDDQWRSVIDTNLTGAFNTIRRATAGHDARAIRTHCERRCPLPDRADRPDRPTTPRPKRDFWVCLVASPASSHHVTSPATWSRRGLS